ncbi:cell division control protein 73 [[Candida] anglica]|uniref:Cell division control protein 73 n=1 Tax=[Candida] anglica TaxID=148631 RepID=A0ABP0EDJ0_9ASCO
MSPLQKFRAACVKSQPVVLQNESGVETQSIKEAATIKVNDDVFPLDTVTEFYSEDKPQSLRSVVFCWLHDRSSISDYRTECLDNGIQDFKFLVKTELSAWLSGKSETCEFVKNDNVDGSAASRGNGVTTSDSSVKTDGDVGSSQSKSTDINAVNVENSNKRKLELQYESDSIDHNAALRGSKNIDFGYLISDAKRLIQTLKKSKPGQSSALSSSGHSSSGSKSAKKQPIIIVSPATTSLLSLANIKEFFENGRFVDPNDGSVKKPSSGIITISHESERLVSAAQQIMVVDNVDIFTKPEYWDRVVAVFTTGQTWQFSKYKYSRPEDLFQRYTGFYVSYQGDVTPKQIKDWNVTEIKVDRGDKRFRDKMIVRDFWAQMEKVLIGKGYGK